MDFWIPILYFYSRLAHRALLGELFTSYHVVFDGPRKELQRYFYSFLSHSGMFAFVESLGLNTPPSAQSLQNNHTSESHQIASSGTKTRSAAQLETSEMHG